MSEKYTPDTTYELASGVWLDLHWSDVDPFAALVIEAADGKTIETQLRIDDLQRMSDQLTVAKLELIKRGE